MTPTWVGVGVIGGGGLLAEASFLRRFGVEGIFGVGETSLDFRTLGTAAALMILPSALFPILFLFRIVLELVGSSTTFVGDRTAATRDERLKDMLRMNDGSRV